MNLDGNHFNLINVIRTSLRAYTTFGDEISDRLDVYK